MFVIFFLATQNFLIDIITYVRHLHREELSRQTQWALWTLQQRLAGAFPQRLKRVRSDYVYFHRALWLLEKKSIHTHILLKKLLQNFFILVSHL